MLAGSAAGGSLFRSRCKSARWCSRVRAALPRQGGKSALLESSKSPQTRKREIHGAGERAGGQSRVTDLPTQPHVWAETGEGSGLLAGISRPTQHLCIKDRLHSSSTAEYRQESFQSCSPSGRVFFLFFCGSRFFQSRVA